MRSFIKAILRRRSPPVKNSGRINVAQMKMQEKRHKEKAARTAESLGVRAAFRFFWRRRPHRRIDFYSALVGLNLFLV